LQVFPICYYAMFKVWANKIESSLFSLQMEGHITRPSRYHPMSKLTGFLLCIL